MSPTATRLSAAERNDTVLDAALIAVAPACDDPEICEVVRNGYGDLVAYVQRVSGLPAADIAAFFAKGMLLNVLSAMQVRADPDADHQADPEPWAQLLLEGCGKEI